MKKNSKKRVVKKVLKIFLFGVVILILILRFYPKGYGSTGLRPITHGCIGFRLDTQFVHSNFPAANIMVGGFQYFVVDTTFMYTPETYCLGRDVFYGE